MKNRTLLLAGILLLFAGCATNYKGAGDFSEITRTYIPVIGVTRGYMIEMPTFSPEKDLVLSYSLAGMPRQNNSFAVEIAIYIPSHQLSLAAQRALDVSVPAGHEVHVSLIDNRTNAVVGEATSKISNLRASDTIEFQEMPYIKRLFSVDFKDVPKNADLEIRVDYRINGAPLKRDMKIIIVNDAPLA
jgi:hypothetical protein